MNWIAIASALAAVLGLASTSSAEAQSRRGGAEEPSVGVEVSVTSAPSSLSPYRYVFTLRPTHWSTAEVVADRRLLTFVVHPEGRGRRRICRHPERPRRAPEGRVVTLGAGADDPEHREWIDLRMYCWGRALRALSSGARVEVHYGFRRRGRGRWVARRPGDEDERTRKLEGGEIQFAAVDAEDAEESADEGSEPPLVQVTMAPINVRTGGGVVFRPRLRARERSQVYVRDDLFRYRIDGPLGETECALDRTPIAPIIDFYRRIGPRRPVSGTLAISLACPDAFQVAGIYEVTPIVDLVYDEAGWDLDDVITGTFEGEPTVVRVRRGERGYVEQVPGTDVTAESRGDS